MKRFFTKIGRFFWSWGFLKFVLWTATLIVAFYVEEGWRGARALAATKAEWKAKGESFDYNHLIPPPVPDNQNLGTFPLFQPDPKVKGYPGPFVALVHAIRQNLPGGDLPSMGNQEKGELPDMEKIRSDLANEYVKAFKDSPPTQDPLAQLDAIYPFMADLRAAANRLPFCRFAEDYTSLPVYERTMTLETSQLKIARILKLHAILALNEHQPDMARADIQTILKLSSGMSHEPYLLSGLIACLMNTNGCDAIGYGLMLHFWNDAQLVEWQESLTSLDPLTNYQLGMRSEAVSDALDMDYLKKQKSHIGIFFSTVTDSGKPTSYLRNAIFMLWPDGWIDLSQSRVVNIVLGGIVLVSPELHRVYPDQDDQMVEQTAQHWNIVVQQDIFESFAVPLLNTLFKFAQTQVRIDETRMACALERYHLARGVYPDLINDLAPAYLPEVPHDPMNGQPYHYRLRPDGTFLLYSVGWNLKDDGGAAAFTLVRSTAPNANPQKRDDIPPKDWVWPTFNHP